MKPDLVMTFAEQIRPLYEDRNFARQKIKFIYS